MTNLERLKKQIANANVEELIDIFDADIPWCKATKECKENCNLCAKHWLEAEYIEPMPELEVGMMVHVKYSDGKVTGLGIIRTWNNNLIVTYEDGGFDPVDDEDVIIDAIYKAPSFGYVDSTNLAIWRKN